MADYISLAFFVLLMNVIPAFMPPTWMILALAYIHDQSFDPLALTVVGAISSGRQRRPLVLQRVLPQVLHQGDKGARG
jgi:hypothetical protein